jgi:DNA-binding protein YbaB
MKSWDEQENEMTEMNNTWQEEVGSRIRGGHCGWSQDISGDAEVVRIEIDEVFIPETGETIQYRTITYRPK